MILSPFLDAKVMINSTLTREEKIAVIQRGMARLPAMGLEAQWAFGTPVASDFAAPPIWVRRAIMMTFDVDPDKGPSGQSIDPLEAFKRFFRFLSGREVLSEAGWRDERHRQRDGRGTLRQALGD